jgi:preprotein translocase subunit SecA
MRFRHEEASALEADEAAAEAPLAAAAGGGGARPAAPPPRPQTVTREGRKVGRNEPCPCGSGKKYKHCHGQAA